MEIKWTEDPRTPFKLHQKLFSKELITFSTDDIKSCETRTELYTQDGSKHDR